MENIEKAIPEQFSTIYEIYSLCKSDLLRKGIMQWGDWSNNYPNRRYINDAIANGELYILKTENEIIGAFILNEKQSDEWNIIEWMGKDEKALIIHALVIKPHYQGKGFGKMIMKYCEQHALQAHYGSMRLDSFVKNEHSNNLYQNMGYTNLGRVIFKNKPEGNKEYYCYEKILKSV